MLKSNLETLMHKSTNHYFETTVNIDKLLSHLNAYVKWLNDPEKSKLIVDDIDVDMLEAAVYVVSEYKKQV